MKWLKAFCLFILGITLGFAEPTKMIENSLGVNEVYINPYSYILALPIDGEVIDGKYTNIRVAPYGTPELFDVSILFCEDVTPIFADKEGPVVIVYETRAHAMHKGIPCKTIKAVFEVPTK